MKKSRTAQIRVLVKQDPAAGKKALTELLLDLFGITANAIEINYDQYSLNSLNGFFECQMGMCFFKFHQEDGEEDMNGEYYRAELLANAELPIDLPILKSTQPGEQILVYKRRGEQRFSDVLRALDVNPDEKKISEAIASERYLNEQILKVARRTLHAVDGEQVASEPIHHLFYDRMINPKTGCAPGGRYLDFYLEKSFDFDRCELTWDEFSTAEIKVNGQVLALNFGKIFSQALNNLNPENLTSAGGFTAHGDAHNANVWYQREVSGPRLVYFDPAFAGEHIPSILAEVKATFHNIFAHPFWLYEQSQAASRYSANVSFDAGTLEITTNWELSVIRQELLEVKAKAFWRPFLTILSEKKMLPENWRAILRSALAMCPALVMNLRPNADRHNSTSAAIGFAMIALAGAEPRNGQNMFTQFFDQIDPNMVSSGHL